MNHLIAVSIVCAFFVACPRLAGITGVINNAAYVNLAAVSVIGPAYGVSIDRFDVYCFQTMRIAGRRWYS
ncbi:MAG: hypothetical protein WC357_01705 [Candidatus Omnitrophota bacterium]|jgi:hypothetical protein